MNLAPIISKIVLTPSWSLARITWPNYSNGSLERMEGKFFNLNDPIISCSLKSSGPTKKKMVGFSKGKNTKWKKKEDARNFLTDVQNTLTNDSQEAKELRKQFFPSRSLADSVAKTNLLMPAAVAVPAIGNVS